MAGRTKTRYLVTGGAGFVGSYLVNALPARGDSVVVLDNLTTGRPANLDEAGESPGFHFVHGSVLDELLVDEPVHQCDLVVHMAAAVGVRPETTKLRASTGRTPRYTLADVLDDVIAEARDEARHEASRPCLVSS